MKARTKAAKIKAKRGRPRLPPRGTREPYDGRKSRRLAETEGDAMSTVIEFRQRKALEQGEILTRDEAANPKRGSVLGLLNLDGAINDAQYEAGRWYAQVLWNYYALTGIPFPSARAQNLFAVRGHDGEISTELAKRARDAANKKMEVEGWILRMGNDRHRIKNALNEACFHDEETVILWPEHMIKYVIRGLNEIIIQAGLRNE